MVIELGTVSAGFSKRQEIRNALMRFKESGKKIYVSDNKNNSEIKYNIFSVYSFNII